MRRRNALGHSKRPQFWPGPSWCSLILAMSGCLAAGCGRSGPSTVSGRVTVNGQPVAEGTIDFLALDGSTATASERIVSGRYTAQVPPGPKKVVIRAYRVVGQEPASPLDPNSPTVDKKEQFLPDKYSAETSTELKADIRPAGNRSLDFELTVP